MDTCKIFSGGLCNTFKWGNDCEMGCQDGYGDGAESEENFMSDNQSWGGESLWYMYILLNNIKKCHGGSK